MDEDKRREAGRDRGGENLWHTAEFDMLHKVLMLWQYHQSLPNIKNTLTSLINVRTFTDKKAWKYKAVIVQGCNGAIIPQYL